MAPKPASASRFSSPTCPNTGLALEVRAGVAMSLPGLLALTQWWPVLAWQDQSVHSRRSHLRRACVLSRYAFSSRLPRPPKLDKGFITYSPKPWLMPSIPWGLTNPGWSTPSSSGSWRFLGPRPGLLGSNHLLVLNRTRCSFCIGTRISFIAWPNRCCGSSRWLFGDEWRLDPIADQLCVGCERTHQPRRVPGCANRLFGPSRWFGCAGPCLE